MFTYDVLLESYFTIDKQCKSPFSSDNNHIGTQNIWTVANLAIIYYTVEIIIMWEPWLWWIELGKCFEHFGKKKSRRDKRGQQ